MKQNIKKSPYKIFKLSALLCFIFIQFFGFISFNHALAGSDCTAQVSFGVDPSNITGSQSVTIKGSVNATTVAPFGLSNISECTYPGTATWVSQYTVSIFDQASSKEIFYVNLSLNQSGASSYTWPLPSKTIGVNELKNVSLITGADLSLVAQVKVTDGSGHWYQLTQSTPVTVTIAPGTFTAPTTPPGGTPPAGGTQCTGTGQGTCPTGQTCDTGGTCQVTVSGTTGNSASNLYNPLPEDDLTHAFLVVIQGFLGIIGIWAVMFIIVGGFQMVLASGNEETYLKAKKTITWAILGLAAALLSFSIIAIIEDLLQVNIQPAPAGTTQGSTGNPPNNTTGNPPNNTTGNPPN